MGSNRDDAPTDFELVERPSVHSLNALYYYYYYYYYYHYYICCCC